MFIYCLKEVDPYKAQVVQIVPTANNGHTELVQLHYKYEVLLIVNIDNF